MMVHTPTTKSIVLLIAAVAATQSSVAAFAPNVQGFGTYFCLLYSPAMVVFMVAVVLIAVCL